MSILIGFIITIASLVGGFTALGGHLSVIWQPWEFVIIAGMALGTYVIANPWKVVLDSGVATMQAVTGTVPTQRNYLDLLGLMHALMREVRNKGRNEVEAHIDDPESSEIFKNFPTMLANDALMHFVCDYFRLIIMGSARPHEIEALMDEEIETIIRNKLKPYNSLMVVAEALPALGIVAAVLGVIKAMGALDQSPKLLGSLIGAALVGTFAGIFLSYGLITPLALKIKQVREKQCSMYVIIKQTLLAFMNGALPQIAVEHGRKMISAGERPSIDVVENETIAGPAAKTGNVEPMARAGARS
ncbi:flagellar motor stator protein MotA [Pseudolabrys taiwanensis]|uniref:Flagellar motor stator protein MotA n=1 Tax=Pseudolabrys taiwanensis TaxID=331696 RepID=A0A345ZXV1_9HYPH|nr:flagellar motor stator protein MotA [Pseudolabrys taiwanensis]AXK81748.1 flagellar motor stator protein MotA [Pseudolabrys taiwanensis]